MCGVLLLSHVKGNQELSTELATGWMGKWGWLMASIPDLARTVQSPREEEGGAVSGVRAGGWILVGSPTQMVQENLLPTLLHLLCSSSCPFGLTWKHDFYTANPVTAILVFRVLLCPES